MGFWRLCKLQVELQVVHIRFKAVYARKGAFQNIIWLFSLELKSSKILFDWIVDSCPISSDLLDVKSAILPIFFYLVLFSRVEGIPDIDVFQFISFAGLLSQLLVAHKSSYKKGCKSYHRFMSITHCIKRWDHNFLTLLIEVQHQYRNCLRITPS